MPTHMHTHWHIFFPFTTGAIPEVLWHYINIHNLYHWVSEIFLTKSHIVSCFNRCFYKFEFLLELIFDSVFICLVVLVLNNNCLGIFQLSWRLVCFLHFMCHEDILLGSLTLLLQPDLVICSMCNRFLGSLCNQLLETSFIIMLRISFQSGFPASSDLSFFFLIYCSLLQGALSIRCLSSLGVM